MATYPLPRLDGWIANLAGILPLSALIITDPPKTLHSYELSGRGLLWNWVITPASALLLTSSTGDQASCCCLDLPGATAKLYCIDGRWGDSYPCSNPFTIRTCMELAELSIKHGYTNLETVGQRCQRLRLFRVTLEDQIKSYKSPIYRRLFSQIDQYGPIWTFVYISGWLLYFGALAGSCLSGQYLAAAYLVVLVLTGIVIRRTHGSESRKLLDVNPSKYTRLVIACDSLSGSEWAAFIGPSTAVDSLLNKPLCRADIAAHPRIHHGLLRILIVAQWALTAVACAFQDWNAVTIFAWIAFCAFISSYVCSEHNAISNWLRTNGVRVEKVEMNFTSRRAMLTTLVALNPDKEKTKWIDPILTPSQDRTNWEAALQKCLANGVTGEYAAEPIPYWWKYLVEGVEVAQRVEPWVKGH